MTSQFNRIFAELRSVVKRPWLIATFAPGTSDSFDPIEIPDDITAIHVALSSNPDSVSVDELERSLQFVTDLSAQRQADMLEATSAGVQAKLVAQFAAAEAEQAELIARISSKQVEREKGLFAKFQAHDEATAAKFAA